MQKIIVENFGPIEHAEIELRDFVVLIGEQASGKSTLAKLVYFFKRYSTGLFVISSEMLLANIQSGKITDWNIVRSNLERDAYKFFIQLFGPADDLKPFKIKYFFSVEKDKWVVFESKGELPVVGKNALQAKYSDGFIQSFNTELKNLSEKFINENSKKGSAKNTNSIASEEDKTKLPTGILLDIIDEFANAVYETSGQTIYFPAGRNITVNFSGLFADTFSEKIATRWDTIINKSDWILIKSFLDHVKYINEEYKTHKDFESMSRNYKSLGKTFNAEAVSVFLKSCRAILKGKYESNGSGEKIRLDGNGDKSISLENTSTGQQESIRILQDIYLMLLNNLSDYRIFEEPESHLFPSAQKYLIELFALVVNTTSSQVFLTTHSPYVLSILANLLYAGKVNKLNAATVSEIEDKTGISHLTWLDKEKFAAYTMDGGKAVSIFNIDGSGMIDQNFLDQISEELGREFQVLYNLRAKQIKENRSNA
jgi:AAA15 family ATPase/GTPase